MHEVAAAWFREQLRGPGRRPGAPSRSEQRGLTADTVERLGLGFAPPSRDGLKQRLLKAGLLAAAAWSGADWSWSATTAVRWTGSGTA